MPICGCRGARRHSGRRATAPHHDRHKTGNQQYQEWPVASTAVQSRRAGLRQRDIGIADRIEAGPPTLYDRAGDWLFAVLLIAGLVPVMIRRRRLAA